MVSKLKFKGEKHKKRKRSEYDELGREGATSSQNTNAEEEGWVDAESLEDITTGPLFITFTSSPPIAIASDQLGRVYASNLKLSEDDSGNAVSEPDDVRQVWVATQLAESTKISLKTPTGKFLSCDKVGILSATTEAIGPKEEWIPIQREDGWAFQNVYEKFMYVLCSCRSKLIAVQVC